MIKAIKVLEQRIELLNGAIKTAENTMEEPELLSDYEWALNQQANCEIEILELTEAIKILNHEQGK